MRRWTSRTPKTEPADDLAHNRPGQAARAQARAQFWSAPLANTVAQFQGRHTEERAWRVGADGEKLVAQELEQLGHRWRALHAIQINERGTDIDHLLIGPAGIFTINAKYHPTGSVWVNGDMIKVGHRFVHYADASRIEAFRAQKKLSAAYGRKVPVTGLVAVRCPKFRLVSQPEPGVRILHFSQLIAWLGQQREVLQPSTVDAIFDVARQRSTWLGD